MNEDLFRFKKDGTLRQSSISNVLRHFKYSHLPEHLQSISKPCAELAVIMADTCPENADLTVGLRDLLAAKDNFVRSNLPY